MTEFSESSTQIFDTVSWDYDPEDDAISSLVPTERYFADFPWEGDLAEETEGTPSD